MKLHKQINYIDCYKNLIANKVIKQNESNNNS